MRRWHRSYGALGRVGVADRITVNLETNDYYYAILYIRPSEFLLFLPSKARARVPVTDAWSIVVAVVFRFAASVIPVPSFRLSFLLFPAELCRDRSMSSTRDAVVQDGTTSSPWCFPEYIPVPSTAVSRGLIDVRHDAGERDRAMTLSLLLPRDVRIKTEIVNIRRKWEYFLP